MDDKPNAVAGLLAEVPAAQRHRIVSGMRWTVWLSAISLPFSYGTTILLARVSPEAIGTYGLMSVYIGLVLGLFYLGGDAVTIKYIPELDPEKRLSFLGSYFFLICVATLPWLAAAAIWPRMLHHFLGEQTSPSFQLLLLILSPLSILTSLVGAALKGLLEIRWAQLVARLVTIGSFLVYLSLFVLSHSLLSHSYTYIIWGTYLGLSVIGAALGLQRLFHLIGWRGRWRSLKFFLPRGFWHYTLSLQQLSALGFFTQRLDAILILNFGGLTLLGQYVALLALAEATRLISRFFLDTLLPALSNMIATQNIPAASDVFAVHMRIIFLVSAASTSGLILLSRPITTLLGSKYENLTPHVILLSFLVGLSTPSSLAGPLLSSIGKQQRAVGVAMGQIALYLALFLWLWPRWQLLGAVVAYGTASVVSSFLLLIIAKFTTPITFSVTRDYVVFILIALASVLVAELLPMGLFGGLLVWLGLIGLQLLLARYSMKECKNLSGCFLPYQFKSSAPEPKT